MFFLVSALRIYEGISSFISRLQVKYGQLFGNVFCGLFEENYKKNNSNNNNQTLKNTYDDSYTPNNLVLEEKINCTGNMSNGKSYRSIRNQLINTVLNVKANVYKLKLEDNFGDCKNLWGAIISVLNKRDDDLNRVNGNIIQNLTYIENSFN